MDEITVESEEFDETLYQENLNENSFASVETDGKGADQ